jgi:hypothetical protein
LGAWAKNSQSYRKVIQEKVFIAEKNAINTLKFNLAAISVWFCLVIGAR